MTVRVLVVCTANVCRSPMAGEGLHHWLDEVAKSRSARDLMGDDPADDIADPYGATLATLAVHRQCSAEIDQLAEVVARTLAGTDVSGPTGAA